MPLITLLSLLVLLAGLGWLARARRLRRARRARVRTLLLQANVGGERFIDASVDALPAPAARYLRRALAPGAPLARSADIRMSGSLRVAPDDWVPFAARQRLCPERGFIWEARIAALRRLGVSGADWLFGDDAGVEYALADWWSIVARHGPEAALSAAGRMAIELVWMPAALTPQRGARWVRGDAERAVVTPAGGKVPLTLVVAEDGRLREASAMRRRVGPDDGTSISSFGVSIEKEGRWGDFRVPERLVTAWGIGTDDRMDFMRLTVEDIRWL
ncbi:MAG: DUF6544 family protein [Gammaproteobacteria bacterium]